MILKAVSKFLAQHLGHEVVCAENGEIALKTYLKDPFPLVLSDIMMPGMDGLELLKHIKSSPQGDNTDVVLITAHGELATAVKALRAGAYDYLTKPPEVDELAALVNRAAEHRHLLKENTEFQHRFEDKVKEATQETLGELENLRKAYAKVVGIGTIGFFSEKMKNIAALAQRFHEERSVTVLIEGETGTGKEIIARLIHYGEKGSAAPFISINCSAIPGNLFESELFGYESGAFSDANKSGKMGKLELANGGTIFLDEIGDLPLDLQPKLLRAIQEREIYRIGGLKKINLDVRIICATNRNLEDIVREKLFRSDLFFRLNMGRIHIPPLRERNDEIVDLAFFFLKKAAERKKHNFTSISDDADKILRKHQWPGNVRELENAIERVIFIYTGNEITADHLDFLRGKTTRGKSDTNDSNKLVIRLPENSYSLLDAEKKVLQKALEVCRGNKTKTASYLGLSLSTFKRKLARISKI